MPGERELLAFLPPILLAGASIVNTPASGPATTLSLAEARIAGSSDPLYGTIGWTPRLDNAPFAVISSGKTKESQYETGRVRTQADIHLFIAVAVAAVPSQGLSLNDQAVAWRDAMRALIPQHRRLSPQADNLWPTAGDVRWEMGGADIKDRYDVLGVAYWGVDITTMLSWTTLVQFQA